MEGDDDEGEWFGVAGLFGIKDGNGDHSEASVPGLADGFEAAFDDGEVGDDGDAAAWVDDALGPVVVEVFVEPAADIVCGGVEPFLVEDDIGVDCVDDAGEGFWVFEW